MIKATKSAVEKIEAVFIRKSGPSQDERPQIANCKTGLKQIGVVVSDQFWIVGTVKRRKVSGNDGFRRLMELVEAGKVRTVYIESQDRWGTSDRVELFALLGLLRAHKTALVDLRAKKDLTEKDLATEMLAFMQSVKSEAELKDIAFRSLRTRVNNFKDSGSWPTGCQPFGFGKACYSVSGELLWEWHPSSRTKGQVFHKTDGASLTPGPSNVPIPTKARGERQTTFLVPHRNKAFIESVRLIYDLFTRVGLSRRQISVRLNKEGRRYYGREFSPSIVTEILSNPAYVGDTHFGKLQAGELQSFDGDGVMVEIKEFTGKRKRGEAERLIKRGTHKALVDRATWELAQAKLKGESGRVSFSPRNPAYYLKQLFVCGHCGRGLVGRTERDPVTKAPTVVYVCPTYITGRINGHNGACGYQRIKHEDAERMLFDKIAELNLPHDAKASKLVRANLEAQFATFEFADDDAREKWWTTIEEGVAAVVDYFRQKGGIKDESVLLSLSKSARVFYRLRKLPRPHLKHLKASLTDFRAAIEASETASVEGAKRRLAELAKEHEAYTKKWVEASELQEPIFKKQVEGLERDIREWTPKAIPLTERLAELYRIDKVRRAEREKLCREWPALENREKGEALRRLFNKVTLFWQPTFHPALAKPTRPRKTARPGRYSYALAHDRIGWSLADTDLPGTW